MSRKGIPNKFSKKKEISCLNCNVVFSIFPSREGRRKYCTMSCKAKHQTTSHFKKGNTFAAGRVLTEEAREKLSKANKKTWSSPELRLKSSMSRIGNKNPNWIKNPTNYSTIHKWLTRTFGGAELCENKNCQNTSKFYQWALIHGKRYMRKRENFVQLCVSCHLRYDRKKSTSLIALPSEQK